MKHIFPDSQSQRRN